MPLDLAAQAGYVEEAVGAHLEVGRDGVTPRVLRVVVLPVCAGAGGDVGEHDDRAHRAVGEDLDDVVGGSVGNVGAPGQCQHRVRVGLGVRGLQRLTVGVVGELVGEHVGFG